MPYLVDTDILVDVSRRDLDALAYLESLDDWAYSIVTAMELIAGARNKREVRKIEDSLSPYRRVPLNEQIGNRAHELMKEYAKSHGLDPEDALIAATAIEQNLTLATRDRRHFKAIDGLRVEFSGYG
ncbi:type II toxin-antitoxin system VapC family toxin [Acidobacteria bacterium AH-259-G07]|nr:type II toxin-antitoxin system VapC family toxin [Acidobacteria bacterium AH-259-G07]